MPQEMPLRQEPWGRQSSVTLQSLWAAAGPRHFFLHSSPDSSTAFLKWIVITTSVWRNINALSCQNTESFWLWFGLHIAWEKEQRELLSIDPRPQNFKSRRTLRKLIFLKRKKQQFLLRWIFVVYTIRVWQLPQAFQGYCVGLCRTQAWALDFLGFTAVTEKD